MKLVEFTQPQTAQLQEVAQHDEEESSDSLALEYTFLLTQQLETQRQQFSEELAEVERRCNAKTEASRQALAERTAKYEKLSQDLTTNTRKLATLVSQSEKLDAEMKKAQEKLNEESALLASLEANQHGWAQKLEDLQKKNGASLKRKQEALEAVNAQLAQLFGQLE